MDDPRAGDPLAARRRSGPSADACLGGMHVAYLVTTLLAAVANGYAAALNFVGAESVKVVAARVRVSQAWMRAGRDARSSGRTSRIRWSASRRTARNTRRFWPSP
jgi:hypothetical protein